jgi:hypothetical protein
LKTNAIEGMCARRPATGLQLEQPDGALPREVRAGGDLLAHVDRDDLEHALQPGAYLQFVALLAIGSCVGWQYGDCHTSYGNATVIAKTPTSYETTTTSKYWSSERFVLTSSMISGTPFDSMAVRPPATLKVDVKFHMPSRKTVQDSESARIRSLRT